MDWTTPPLEPMLPAASADPPPALVRPATQPTPKSEPTGPSVRRLVLTGGLAGLLLVAGGVAAVSAASPDPSTAPSTSAPSTSAPNTTPPTTTQDGAAPSGRAGHGCPNMDGSSGGSGGSGTTPSAPTTPTTPAPTPAV
jgi:hypothetical protein